MAHQTRIKRTLTESRSSFFHLFFYILSLPKTAKSKRRKNGRSENAVKCSSFFRKGKSVGKSRCFYLKNYKYCKETIFLTLNIKKNTESYFLDTILYGHRKERCDKITMCEIIKSKKMQVYFCWIFETVNSYLKFAEKIMKKTEFSKKFGATF